MILILLAFCMATALFVSCNNKQEDDAQNNEQNVFEDDKFVYQVEDDRVIIYAYKGKDENVKIPSEYNGKPVTKIDESAFENCDFIKSVEIPDSVTSIGMFAFHGCTALESVKLSNALTQLNESLFADCESLTSIEIPNGVVSIRDGAFSGCSALENIYCEAAKKPEYWDDGWNEGCPANIHWGDSWHYADGVPTIK